MTTRMGYPQTFGDKGYRDVDFSVGSQVYGFDNSTDTTPVLSPFKQNGGGFASLTSSFNTNQGIIVPSGCTINILRSAQWGPHPELDLTITVDGAAHTLAPGDSVTLTAGSHTLNYFSSSGGPFALIATHSCTGPVGGGG